MRIQTQLATSVGGLVAIGVAGLLVPVRTVVPGADVALALVVVVTVAAAVGGRWAGVVTGGVAALAFDLLHTRPYGSFAVRGPVDALTTALLVVVGLVTGEVAERLHVARGRQSDLDGLARLHRLGAQAASGASEDDLAREIAADLVGALHLRSCWFEPAPFLADLPVLTDDGTVVGHPRRWGRGLPRSGASILLGIAARPVGRFVLVPDGDAVLSLERRLLAVALVDQLAVVRSLRAA